MKDPAEAVLSEVIMKRERNGRRLIAMTSKNTFATSHEAVTGWAYHPEDVPVHRQPVKELVQKTRKGKR
jgi:hypothetical protein